MDEELRKSGIDVIGEISWGTHFCQFYQTKEDLMDIVVPYFKAGLENNEFCIWITSQPLEVEEAKEGLRRIIPDIDAYLDKGQIETIPYTHGYINEIFLDPQRTLDYLTKKINQALDNGYDGLRFSIDIFWLKRLERTDWQDLIYHEEKLDSVIVNYRVIALCTYFIDRCDITRIIDVATNHQFTLAKKEGKWKKIENSGRKRAEEAENKLKEALESLEKKVKARTAKLEKAYNSLKESERSLAEAQKMAHIGSWDWDLIKDKTYWSDEMYRIFGLTPQKFGLPYSVFLTYVHPDDRDYVDNAIKRALRGESYDIDYRMILADGTERIVHSQAEVVFDEKNIPVRMIGTIQDITERKTAEEALEKMDQIRMKEIHHRIKNNLQIISSLLSLEAERFNDTKILEAFKESQDRVTSMALIHEELYKGSKADALDFGAYIQKLTAELFSSYNVGDNISLELNLEQVYLDMDTAIPLGIIVNELVSNSLKHAFSKETKGEIYINLHKVGVPSRKDEISDSGPCFMEKGNFNYTLTVADNGKGIPEEIDLDNVGFLGLQLVNLLVEQIDGCIELKRNHGTKFTIWFDSIVK